MSYVIIETDHEEAGVEAAYGPYETPEEAVAALRAIHAVNEAEARAEGAEELIGDEDEGIYFIEGDLSKDAGWVGFTAYNGDFDFTIVQLFPPSKA